MNNTEMIKKINEEISRLIDSDGEFEKAINRDNAHLIALTNLLIKKGIISKEELNKEIVEVSK